MQAATVEGVPVFSGVGLGSGVGSEALDGGCVVEDHCQAAGRGVGCAAGDVDECLAGGRVLAVVAVEAEVLLAVGGGGHAEDVEGAFAEDRGDVGYWGVGIHAVQVVSAVVGREGGGGHAHHAVVGDDDDGCAQPCTAWTSIFLISLLINCQNARECPTPTIR